MPEVYSFPEGTIHVWTGLANASGTPIAYCENTQIQPMWGWDNVPSLSGVYRDHLTGLSITMNINAGWTFDKKLAAMAGSATAVHAKFMASSVNGSGGYIMYSGRIDNLSFNGGQAGTFQFALAYHANIFSAF